MRTNYYHHVAMARKLEAQATCHKIMAGADGFTERVADAMLTPGGLSALDAALQAVQQGHGEMFRASEYASERSRAELQVMGAARFARENGLRLVDIERCEEDECGPSMTVRYWLSFIDFQRVKMAGSFGAHREVLRRALDAGLVSEPQHCQHSYDCCGHWYANSAGVKWIEPNLYVVEQRSYQNV